MDGRDIGTHVLPEAKLKIFLTASLDERARRRWLELERSGKKLEFEDVKEDMERRDRLDAERDVSPLMPAEDAVILDTTGLSVGDIVEQILDLVRN
jgi:cytidylate kinase